MNLNKEMMNEFSGKVAIITGGSSGIGKAAAELLNQAGCKTSIFSRDLNKLKSTSKNLKNNIFIQGDVCKADDLERLYLETTSKLGGIDILVANAGNADRGLVGEEFFDTIVNTNYKGTFFTVQKAVPHLNSGASIILVSFMGCHLAWPAHSVYSSAKAAVSMLAKNFAADLINRNIRVNAISPGYTKTPMYDGISNNDEFINNFSKQTPMKRFASVDEIANSILFLASKKSSYITGIDLVVDGGMTSIYIEDHN